MKNVNILKDLNTLNKLHTSSVESHTTNNGIVDFTCDNAGYVDNVVIEGETLVNLFSFKKTESSNNNSVWVHINTDYISLFKKVEYTLINTSNKNIFVDVYSNDTNSYKRNLLIKANSSIKDTLASNEHYSKCTGLFSDSWSLSDLSVISSTLVILEGDHTDKPISYFEGLKSVGQGDNIEVLSCADNIYSDTNKTVGKILAGEGVLVDYPTHDCSDYIVIEPNSIYYTNIQHGFVVYDANKNIIDNKATVAMSSVSGKYIMPNNAKYLRVNLDKDTSNYLITKKYDKKQISTTLRSLPNGVKDTIEKRGNKYVKVQRCGEYTFTGYENISFISDTNGLVQANIDVNFAIKSYGDNLSKNVVSNMLPSLGNISNKETIFKHPTVNNCIVVRISNSKITADKTICLNYIKDKLTIVYELATPQIIELPNFNSQTYKGDNTLLINSGVIQCDASFDMCEGIRSELDVIKDKVSSFNDNTIYSEDIQLLNGWEKDVMTSKVTRQGNLVHLCLSIKNGVAESNTFIGKLSPMFIPKEHSLFSGTVCNSEYEQNIGSITIGITGNIRVYDTKKLNTRLLINATWEVE